MSDILNDRIDLYFRHPDATHEVLRVGDHCVACANLRRAFFFLRVPGTPVTTYNFENYQFDDSLTKAVRAFQKHVGHHVEDGEVGPGTRERIVSELLPIFNQYPSTLLRFEIPEVLQAPSVFISYAWADSAHVDELDQWLRDHGIRVMRDRDFFVPGTNIEDNISKALTLSSKVVAMFSKNSSNRDWPHLERTLAEQVEARLKKSVLIYVLLDETKLPAHDPNRIAIDATRMTLKEVGEALLHAILGVETPPPRIEYNEDERIG